MWTADDTQTRLAADARRSPRVLGRVRLRLDSGDRPACEATTAVINAHGALVLSPVSFPHDARVLITNLDRGARGAFRIVWCGERLGSLVKLGVEMLAPDAAFWGAAYGPEATD